MLDESIIWEIIIAIGTAIMTIVVLIKNAPVIKQFLNPIRNKISQWANHRAEREKNKKAQKILDKKITRTELIDLADAIYEISEDTHSIIRAVMCMLIQTINEPDNEALRYFMHRKGYGAKRNIKDIERWLNYLWAETNDMTETGEIAKLDHDIRKLRDKIKALSPDLEDKSQ